ncbi:hypothetical protein QQZ08_010124 [Neonectria magnoliae]|uniref:Uncharacterized protein n=1 Tax=Neonectria magnoliae TaxID=2732573 RepID=A0ABR1HIU8_9HYPO
MKITAFIAALTAASTVTALVLPPPSRTIGVQQFDSVHDLKQLKHAQNREYDQQLKEFKKAQKEKHRAEMQQAFEIKNANDIKKHEAYQMMKAAEAKKAAEAAEAKAAEELKKAKQFKQMTGLKDDEAQGPYEVKKAHFIDREQELHQSPTSIPGKKVGAQVLQSGPGSENPEVRVNVTVTFDTPGADENGPTRLTQDTEPTPSVVSTSWKLPGRITRFGPRRKVIISNKHHDNDKQFDDEEDRDKRCVTCGVKYLDDLIHKPVN